MVMMGSVEHWRRIGFDLLVGFKGRWVIDAFEYYDAIPYAFARRA